MAAEPNLAERLMDWLFEAEPGLAKGDEISQSRVAHAMAANIGAFMGPMLAARGEATFEAALKVPNDKIRAEARQSAAQLLVAQRQLKGTRQ